MTPSQTAHSEGFAALLEHDGETITFRGLSVTALVNLTPQPQPDAPGAIDFTAREISEVEFLTTAVASAPKAGEFIAAGGRRHKIEKVFPRGDTYLCRCFVTA